MLKGKSLKERNSAPENVFVTISRAHAVSNSYGFLSSVEHKRRILKKKIHSGFTKDTKTPLIYHKSGPYDSSTLFQVFWSNASYTDWNLSHHLLHILSPALALNKQHWFINELCFWEGYFFMNLFIILQAWKPLKHSVYSTGGKHVIWVYTRVRKWLLLNLFYFWVNKSFSEQRTGFKILNSTSAGFIL